MKTWNSEISFPQDNYIIRCIDESFGPSKSSQNPMITLGFEFVAPETITVAGEEYGIAGVKIPDYLAVTKVMNEDGSVDSEKSDNCKTRLNKLCIAFGLPAIDNPDNPTLGFKNKLVWALCNCNTVERRKSPTAEQLAKGQKQGDVLKNPITGKPLVLYFPKIVEIFGPAEAPAGYKPNPY